MFPLRFSPLLCAVLAATLATACQSGRRMPGGRGDSGVDSGMDAGPRDAAPRDARFDPDAACATAVSMATVERRPVDIIWVVDNSSSMAPAIEEVKRGLNDFAGQIADSGLDYRVIMLSLRGATPPAGATRYPVCIPMPLAGDGSCGNGDRFFHSSVDVKSEQPLEHFLGTLGQTDGFREGDERGGEPWAAFLRPEATKTIVVVSDDDSRLTPDEFEHFAGGANPYNTTTLPEGILEPRWEGLFDGYTFDAIYGWGSESDPTVTCMFTDGTTAMRPGETYTSLVSRTGGVRAQICDGASAWGPFFDAVATTVEETARIACEIPLPAPPEGMMLDPTKVNVLLEAEDTSVVFRVPDASGCGAEGGWHYDDDTTPTQVILCPSTCEDAQARVSAEGSAGFSVAFGCDTLFI